ncbi:MAG: ribonuclease HIII [Lutisporaceae bacterium]
MYKTKDKYQYYEYLKSVFEKNGVEVSHYEDIKYGLQFSIIINEKKRIIRVYENKKRGIRCDLSLIKDEEILKLITGLVHGGENNAEEDSDTGLIGTDESGKGDYFGPLIIAGVYADSEMKEKLKEIGVADSKTLSDARIRKLADEITGICKYSVVIIGNKRYNELYDKIGNLNKLLAWGHARVIENLLEDVDCSNVLSDQFGSPELIKNALLERGRKINLEQRPRAEENVVVAAASILARNEYVKAMNKLAEEYGMEFPKGSSSAVSEAARKFVLLYGKEKLINAAKLHFVITKKL